VRDTYRTSFTDNDLLYLVKTLSPDAVDAARMVRVLRDDQEILEGMLSDERLALRLVDDPLSLLQVSARLFFAILIRRVRADLRREGYTLEQTSGHSLALFDTPQVVGLLENPELSGYLTELLVSFVRINSFSTPVRVKPGVWRRARFSDFDIDSLVRYGGAIDESRRFPVYKRIADICLFTLGIMRPAEEDPGPASGRRTPQDYVTQGVSFYRLAARHREAEAQRLSDVLETLSERFTLAVKPLSAMSRKYLAPFRDTVFPQ
jgi:hypothetical protein